MSEIEPVTVYSQEWSDDGNFSIRAESYYPDEVLDEMARRVGNELDEEIIRRLGYVKPVRCRDCKRQWVFDLSGLYETHEHDQMYCALVAGHSRLVMPDGYCAWGVRKED